MPEETPDCLSQLISATVRRQAYSARGETSHAGVQSVDARRTDALPRLGDDRHIRLSIWHGDHPSAVIALEEHEARRLAAFLSLRVRPRKPHRSSNGC
jgi:hypothetical protein